jgi:hypothetical protein
MVHDFHVIATALQCLAFLGNILLSVHIPVLSRGIKLWEEERYIRLNNEINHALLTASYYLKVSANYYS